MYSNFTNINKRNNFIEGRITKENSLPFALFALSSVSYAMYFYARAHRVPLTARVPDIVHLLLLRYYVKVHNDARGVEIC